MQAETEVFIPFLQKTVRVKHNGMFSWFQYDLVRPGYPFLYKSMYKPEFYVSLNDNFTDNMTNAPVFESEPLFFGDRMYVYDLNKMKTFMTKDKLDLNDETLWLPGRLHIVGDFAYYKNSKEHTFYIAHSSDCVFHECVDASTEYPMDSISNVESHPDYVKIKYNYRYWTSPVSDLGRFNPSDE